MSPRIRLLLLLLVAPPAAHVVFGQKGFGISGTPTWVTRADYSQVVEDTANTSGGYYYLLYTQQINPETQEIFTEVAIKVLNENGLDFAASINETFDPTFQQLDFHTMSITRDGTVHNKLTKGDFEIIRREENLSRSIYDGSLSAILNLKGVRTGDIVAYSFTTKGFNKVFEGHFFRRFYFNYGAPTGKIYFKVIASPSRKIRFKDFNHAIQRKEAVVNGLRTYEWEGLHMPSLRIDDDTPGWYDPYSRVEMTDFSAVAELSAWAGNLFKVKSNMTGDLKEFVDSLKRLNSTEKMIVAAIRTIQDDVRYLSLSNGMSSYLPHPPGEVFQNKYGDCKDKSLLLSHILQQLGVDSHPVLVHSSEGRTLPDKLPSPSNFDHCILQFTYEDSVYHVDPTISFQRGGLKQIITPRYYHGLVVGGRKDSLTTIPVPTKFTSRTEVTEEYFLEKVGEGAKLVVTSVYHGGRANYMRDYIASKSNADINKGFLNFYANDFPEIHASAVVTSEDDQENNIFTTHEEYTIKKFWTYDSSINQYKGETYARYLTDFLNTPSTKVRTMPYALSYPLDIQQTIKMHMPEEWNVKDKKTTITGPGFIFKYNCVYYDKTIRLEFNINNLETYLLPEKVPEYVKSIKSINETTSFEVTYTPSTEPTSSRTPLNVPFLMIALAVAVIGFFLLRRLYDYDPVSRPAMVHYRQIDGWLILPGIGLSITPFLMTYQLFAGDNFDYAQWRILADPTYASYNQAAGLVVVFEVVFNVGFLLYSVVAAIVFWQRRTSAPTIIAVFYAAHLLFLVIDKALAVYMSVEISNQALIYRTLVAAAIWIPYFLISERSKGTFTRRLSGDMQIR